MIPILFAIGPYETNIGGTFFDYLQFQLLEVDIGTDRADPVYNNGKLASHNPDKLLEYFEKIGRNTDYIIHPEETIADNFMLLFNNVMRVRTPRILDRLREILQK